ncbi:focadhesin [Diabrotica virgifera virgifera]|uniref:DUF3730 domain-containing protein n=1 Tax=Diabrotica virgifera virgifera TaxID=50390 RepID=A0ABM5IXG3_DIAVI|nr:focadhesin [Diabrotica virgifera virgifera]
MPIQFSNTMEEIENKLYSNNPINISTLISKIISNVKKKHENGTKEFPEVKFLKEKLMNPDPLISEVAGVAIIQLIKDGILPVDSVLTDFISTMKSIQCHSTLINTLGELLYLQIIKKENIFNLHSPQHPFIILENENPHLSSHILNKICQLQELDGSIVNKIFEPFYLYCLCCPSKHEHDLLRYRLWTLLLNSNCVDSNFFVNILGWLQVQRIEDLPLISDQLIEALNNPNISKFIEIELIILWLVNALRNLSINKLDAQSVLCYLKKVIENRTLVTIDSILLIFSEVIDTCSPLHLKQLLEVCKTAIKSNKAINLCALETVRASLLPWLAAPCLLTNEAYEVAANIIAIIDNRQHDEKENNASLKAFADKYKDQICTNKTVFLSVTLAMNLERFSQENLLKIWLKELQEVPEEFIAEMFNILCGLMMVDYTDPEISMIILELLLICTKNQISLSSKLLTLILYVIPKNPSHHFLTALPRLIILRDNIPKIIAMIQAVSKGSENLFNMALSLAYDAWKIDNKCYIYLEDLLVQNVPVKKVWERNVVKAYILKKICEKKPELYGKDVIAHLSKILNDCDDDNGALPCSLAIEAITVLCRAGVIDIKTTWSTLSPKFKNDMRVQVVKSLCALTQEIPQLSDTDNYKDLFEDVTKTLWYYGELGNSEISETALLSLTTFGMEHICMHLPEKYLEPGSTPNMQAVSGKTWIQFLIQNGASISSINFIKKMMSIEIDGFLKYVYQPKGPKEPVNYSYLPSFSIVRAIGEFIKTWVNKWRGSIHDKLYLECLNIYSVEYSKPLPPLDWSFLHDLLVDPKTKEYAVDIASHQVVMSGTARRLIEGYLVELTNNPQIADIEHTFRNLKFLSRSIQPMILRPFIENCMWFAIQEYNQNHPELLITMTDYLKNVLQQENIQETNKVTIIEVVGSIIFVTDVNLKLFDLLCQVIVVSPSNLLEVAKFDIVDNEEGFRKTVKIRCALARSGKFAPMNWLNLLIDVWSTNFRGLSLWEELDLVFKTHSKNTDECVPWFLELVGQIQAKIAERSEVENICCLFDILIYAVISFSGFYTLIETNLDKEIRMKELFPSALATLLDRYTWEASSVQMLEWLYHLNMEATVPTEYRKLFGLCLQALKHNEEFIKNQKCMKYLNSRTNFK